MEASNAQQMGLGADEPGALGVDNVLQQVSQNDEEEWEYEYSSIETETYYLTLELSYPEFKDRPTKAPHHSRGGYYKNWLDQYPDSPAKAIKFGRAREDQSENENDDDNDDDDDENENDDEPMPDPEDDDMQHLDPMLRSNQVPEAVNREKQQKTSDKGKGRERDLDPKTPEPSNKNQRLADEEADEVQILDLHSHNPIISYRGRVFEGSWAEVIGTEVLFANHERDNPNPLPAVRQLAGDVDMLGASCSRILTTEKIPKPKVPEEDSLAAIRNEWNIRIPPGKDRTGERAQQIRFLENLIALKKKKGQTDEVTVYAVDGEGKDFNDKKGPDFKPRKRRPALVSKPSDAGKSGGQERRRSGRNSRRQAPGTFGRVERGLRSGGAASRPGGLSVPTPSHWGDLSPRDDEEGEEEDDNYEDNGDDSVGSISEESDGGSHDEDEDEDAEDGDDEDVPMEG